VIAVAFSALYAFYLIVDTQLIMGGRRNELTLDNYILGAMLLYIDIIQLFLNLLRILGERN
jgi:protein lifeguard